MEKLSTHTLTALLSCGSLLTPLLAQTSPAKEKPVAPVKQNNDMRNKFGQNKGAAADNDQNRKAQKNADQQAQDQGDENAADATKKDDMNLAAVLADNSDLSSFADALKTAGLEDILDGKGLYTVFAPSNEAIENIPKEKRDELMKPENKEKLAAILKNHIVRGEITSSDFGATKNSVPDNSNADADSEKADSGKANTDKADSKENAERETNNGDVDRDAKRIKRAHETAPDTKMAEDEAMDKSMDKDEAMDKSMDKDKSKMDTDENSASSDSDDGEIAGVDADKYMPRTTLGGATLKLHKEGKTIKIGKAEVTQADINASNGVIHIIDTVLMPGK